MPSLSTLTDNFNDGVIGPNWGDSYGGVTETGGQARVPLVADTYAGYQTGRAWTFAGASVYLKLATRPAASTGTDVSCNFLVTSSTDGTSIGFKYNAVTNNLRMQSNVAYFDGAAVEITYDPVAHLWLRLREDGTNVYWETAPDGTTWTVRRALATPAWITSSIDTTALDLYGYRDAGTTDYAAYDNVNTLSDGAVHDASATLTAESGLTAAVSYTAIASAALTADGGLTAAATLVAEAAAVLTAESELTADASGSGEFPEGVVGLAAGEHDLHLEQGATFYQTYTCGVGDSPMLWDGWTARAQIRSQAAENADLLLDLTPYLTIAGNKITLQVPASVTENLTRNGRWDLEMVKGAWVVRLLAGAAIVSPEVTR